MQIRIQKFLSDVGFCSRSQAERYIRAGRLSINGEKARLGDKISVDDSVTLDGRALTFKAPPRKKILVFNKPQGIECTLTPHPWKKTLLDFDFGPDRIFPIGRLDTRSQGILLLTNDGELGNRLARTSAELEEEYRVVVAQQLRDKIVDELKSDGGGKAVRSVKQRAENELEIVLSGERDKYIRRICEAAGLQIEELIRVRVGGIQLAELKPSSWRELEENVYADLKKGAAL